MRITLIVLIFLLSACNQRLTVGGKNGNAEGYNGGDASELKLKSARAKLGERLADVSKNLLPARLCKYSECASSGSAWCRVLADLSPSQESSCRDFLSTAIPLIEGRGLPTVELVPGPLQVTENGVPRVVDAETELAETGAILVSAESVKRLAPEEIEVLLFHELGHKTRWKGAFIPDEGPTEGFPTGRSFLDTVAAAFLAYAQNTSIQGFFIVGITGYYGNTIGHYCNLRNFDDWIRAGGPDVSTVPTFSMIPTSMIDDGTCQVP